MAMMASGGSGSRSYSYTVTETYSLEDAVGKASSGELSPREVYRQLPSSLQTEADRLASHKFSQQFSALTTVQQREVMSALKEEIRRAKENREKPLSILEALKMAREGAVDDIKLYAALPDELRKVVDALAEAHQVTNFCAAKPEMRSQILGSLLDMCNKGGREDAEQQNVEQARQDEAKRQAEEQAKQRAQEQDNRKAEVQARQRAEEEAKRRAEEQAKQRAQEEDKRRAEEQAKRRTIIESGRRNANQCILCGTSLGFFNRLFGRERHPDCVAWKE
jgi:hypothetical protein